MHVCILLQVYYIYIIYILYTYTPITLMPIPELLPVNPGKLALSQAQVHTQTDNQQNLHNHFAVSSIVIILQFIFTFFRQLNSTCHDYFQITSILLSLVEESLLKYNENALAKSYYSR